MNLQQAIEKSPYNQRQLAAFLRVSDAKMSRVMNGEAELTISQCRTVAEILDQPVDLLFPDTRKHSASISALTRQAA